MNKCLLTVLCLLAPTGAMAVNQTDYAYRFPLTTPGTGPAWRVELTPAVYAVSRRDAGLRDLVVINAQGREVPFAPMPPTPAPAHPFVLKGRLLPLPVDAAGGVDGVRVRRNANGDVLIDQPRDAVKSTPSQWLLDARREVSLSQIELDPPAQGQDLRVHFAVDASNDLQQWESRNDDTEIVSVKRGDDAVEQRVLTVGGEPARYYRLRRIDGNVPWDSAQTPGVNLRGSYADPLADRAATLQWQTLPAPAFVASAHGGADYDYRLPAVLPVEAARITLASANTAARFTLLTHDEDAGGPAALATITAVQTGKASEDAQPTVFDAVRVQHLRLHTDTPLAQPPTLAVAWHPDAFVFLAEGAGPYSLLAGSYATRRPDYPVDAALEKLRPADADSDWRPAQARVGERVDEGGASALLAPKVPYDWTRPVLWIVLLGGAALVVAMALSLLRQSRRESGDR